MRILSVLYLVVALGWGSFQPPAVTALAGGARVGTAESSPHTAFDRGEPLGGRASHLFVREPGATALEAPTVSDCHRVRYQSDSAAIFRPIATDGRPIRAAHCRNATLARRWLTYASRRALERAGLTSRRRTFPAPPVSLPA